MFFTKEDGVLIKVLLLEYVHRASEVNETGLCRL